MPTTLLLTNAWQSPKTTSMAPMIPRILHQTFRSRRPLAPQLERCIRVNQDLNPDWEYRYYDDVLAEEVVEAQLGSAFVDIYRRIDPHYGASKADIFRYACIYQFGGCYLDIKSICTRPLSTVIAESDQCLLSYWDTERYPGFGIHQELPNAREFQQWFIMASPRHPLIESALMQAKGNLERYSYFRNRFGQMTVLRTTGPIAFTKAVEPLLSTCQHRIVSSLTDLGLEYEGFATLDERVELIGKNYREAVRPLVIPRLVPKVAYPMYFGLSDALARQIRKGLRLYRRVSKRT